MKRIAILFALFFFVEANAQMTFQSERELNNYVWSNTNLELHTSGFLDDFIDDKDFELEYANIFNENHLIGSADNVISGLTYLERSSVKKRNSFDKDPILKKVYDSYYAVTPQSYMDIPFFILDYSISKLDSKKQDIIESWNSEEPYPDFKKSFSENKNLSTSGLLIDSLKNDKIRIFWNDSTFFGNRGRQIVSVSFIIEGKKYKLLKDTRVSLDKFYSANKPLSKISFEVKFSDGEKQFRDVNVFFIKRTNEKSAGFENLFGPIYSLPGSGADLQYSIAYGCDNNGANYLDRPYIIVNGWGPYTENSFVNWVQGWPATMQERYEKYNTGGLIDDLVASGYDVIITNILPPNADVQSNANRVEDLINWVNSWKNYNESTEENILQGFSAGAIAIRLALLKMEKKHMDNNGPHHHSRLYISSEGEHAGANIPLGGQHCLEYLNDYHSGLTISTLYYILNAPLSRNLLKYFYTETGKTGATAGQGSAVERLNYLNVQNNQYHSKSYKNPNYPAFTRNISISNGQNEANIIGNISLHPPFPSEFGHVIFAQQNWLRAWRARYLEPGFGNPFLHLRVRNWQWQIEESRFTSNPWLLDNAPGGIMALEDKNPFKKVMKQMRLKIYSFPQIIDDYPIINFTPTILTHDIRDFNPDNHGGYLNYSMKNSGLMYKSIDNMEADISSNDFGYPHLAHPNDHYSNYTPFDAVFAWSKNTEHVLSLEKVPGEEFGAPTILPSLTNNFIATETDVYDGTIQNIQYGWNTRNNSEYAATYRTHNTIRIGKEVTQRTAFNQAEVLENGNLTCLAGNEIYIAPGFYAHAGSEFHAQIKAFDCLGYKSAKNSIQSSIGKFGAYIVEEQFEDENLLEIVNFNPKSDLPVYFDLSPNPSNSVTTIKLSRMGVSRGIEYKITDFSGKIVEQSILYSLTKEIRLNQGVYLVALKINGIWESKKLVIL